MSDAIKHIDVDSDEFEDTPRALREYVKRLQSQNKDLAKERDDARTQVASRAVADVLAGKNFKNPERVKTALLGDGIDPLDNSAVETWLTANGDDYAKAAADEQTAGEGSEEQAPAAVQSNELAEGYQNLQVAGEPAGTDKWALVQSKITPDMDGAAVAKLYAEHGI